MTFKTLTPEQEEVIRYFLNTYRVRNTSNLPEVEVDTVIGLIKHKLDGNN